VKIVLAILVSLAIGLAVSQYAEAGICPNITQHQRTEIVKHYKQVYHGKTIVGDLRVTTHDPKAQFVVSVYDWPTLVHTIVIPLTNKCATSLYGGGVPQGWPSNVPYPQP